MTSLIHSTNQKLANTMCISISTKRNEWIDIHTILNGYGLSLESQGLGVNHSFYHNPYLTDRNAKSFIHLKHSHQQFLFPQSCSGDKVGKRERTGVVSLACGQPLTIPPTPIIVQVPPGVPLGIAPRHPPKKINSKKTRKP